ncbi:MAG: gamma carbonic anhydrase family protein [Planctomycetota bacterium]
MTFRLHHGVYLADTARVTGEVKLAPGASLWYGAAVRGDVAPITIGPRTNVQDCAVIHCDHGHANHIGADVTIGHGAIVHGRSVGDGTLIGMGAVVMGGTHIGQGCLIAAGAVVPPGKTIPDGHVVMGVPGKVVRELTEEERGYAGWLPPHYLKLAQGYVESPDGPRFIPWDGNAE